MRAYLKFTGIGLRILFFFFYISFYFIFSYFSIFSSCTYVYALCYLFIFFSFRDIYFFLSVKKKKKSSTTIKQNYNKIHNVGYRYLRWNRKYGEYEKNNSYRKRAEMHKCIDVYRNIGGDKKKKKLSHRYGKSPCGQMSSKRYAGIRAHTWFYYGSSPGALFLLYMYVYIILYDTFKSDIPVSSVSIRDSFIFFYYLFFFFRLVFISRHYIW